MTFEQAMQKMLKVYWNKTTDFEASESFKDKKYNKKYFDSVKEQFVTKSEQQPEIEKKKGKY